MLLDTVLLENNQTVSVPLVFPSSRKDCNDFNRSAKLGDNDVVVNEVSLQSTYAFSHGGSFLAQQKKAKNGGV